MVLGIMPRGQGVVNRFFKNGTMTTATLVYAGADLPPRVQRSIARALDPNFPIDLTASERVALAALLRRVEARDGHAAFWVRRLNLAEVFGRVERTVSNWLSALESKGLIEKEQGRTRWGNFSCVTLHLTDLAVTLLGLNAELGAKSTQQKKVAAGYKEGLPSNTKQSTRYPQADLSTGPFAEGQDGQDEHAASLGSRVPADCRPLLDLGLRPSAIFKLMKIATEKGKRLGEVVRARLFAIRKARSPYGLVINLVNANVDYAALHKLETQDKAAKVEQWRRYGTRQAIKEHLAGKWVHRDERTRIHFSDDGMPSIHRFDGQGWFYATTVTGERAIELWERAFTEGWRAAED
jgi:DNA-binding MarR family transcriptional regulator